MLSGLKTGILDSRVDITNIYIPILRAQKRKKWKKQKFISQTLKKVEPPLVINSATSQKKYDNESCCGKPDR